LRAGKSSFYLLCTYTRLPKEGTGLVDLRSNQARFVRALPTKFRDYGLTFSPTLATEPYCTCRLNLRPPERHEVNMDSPARLQCRRGSEHESRWRMPMTVDNSPTDPLLSSLIDRGASRPNASKN